MDSREFRRDLVFQVFSRWKGESLATDRLVPVVEETAWFARDDLVPFLMVGWSSLQWALEWLFAKTWGVCSNWLGIGRRSARHTKVLAEHGAPLSPASFPPSKSRELRDLTRTTLIQERTRLINRVHKVLEDANLKLSSVLTDMLGQTGQPILGAIIRGEEDPTVLADMALRRAAST